MGIVEPRRRHIVVAGQRHLLAPSSFGASRPIVRACAGGFKLHTSRAVGSVCVGSQWLTRLFMM